MSKNVKIFLDKKTFLSYSVAITFFIVDMLLLNISVITLEKYDK